MSGFVAVSGVDNTLPKEHFKNYFCNEETKQYAQDTIMIQPKTLTEIIKNTPFTHFGEQWSHRRGRSCSIKLWSRRMRQKSLIYYLWMWKDMNMKYYNHGIFPYQLM